ncbi:hypothetical protein LZS85_15505 [Aliivibrio fischeri]|uniref:hypothetical protein n=1 Tax=Aliivibrio fischeri TaxID=668 RepID=UPI001F1E46DA|nr:hypothetical protein [Aliivibrio fischeri]MCE7567529.1 hypothetical protein [Aliivibrio fischeri]
MGKGPDKVEETEYQKELARTAAREWNRQQEVFVPLENRYINQVQQMSDESNYEQVSGDVNTSFNSAYENQRQRARKQLSASGINPNSGKAATVQNDLTQDQLAKESQAAGAGQVDATRRYLGHMSNVMAMGKGQETRSIAGLNDIAAASGRKANQDAINKANEVSLPAAAVGAATAGLSTKGGQEWASSLFDGKDKKAEVATNA